MTVLLSLLAVAVTGCSLKSKPLSQTLKVTFPQDAVEESKTKAAASAKLSGARAAPLGNAPASLADFNCFGVLVVGNGMAFDDRLDCAAAGDPRGKIFGLAPIVGGEIELTVPIGQKEFTIFALKSETGCPAMTDLLGQPSASRFSGMSAFYSVGSARLDVSQDSTLPIRITYDPYAQDSRIYASCPGSGTGETAAGHTQARLKIARASLLVGNQVSQPAQCNSAGSRPCLKARAVAGSFVHFGANDATGGNSGSRYGLSAQDAELNSIQGLVGR